jgi:hypothetical protein
MQASFRELTEVRLMKKLIEFAMVVVMVLACALASAEELPGIPPLPEQFKNISIVKPAPSLPKDVADLFGEWEGEWKYVGDMKNASGLKFGQAVRKAKLIVYDIPSPAKVKFLWGIGNSPFYTVKGGWWDNESDIQEFNGKRYFSRISKSEGGQGKNMQFHLEDGILKGDNTGSYSIELKKVR